jgi:hypothetical protein
MPAGFTSESAKSSKLKIIGSDNDAPSYWYRIEVGRKADSTFRPDAIATADIR